MAQQGLDRNPFMLMTHPEIVLAAIEKSERLGRLQRRLCRPLDRGTPDAAPGGEPATADDAAGSRWPEDRG